uniref:Uncharacterized protein n=1 Tax=Sphaerodactylus townsendi TaxID=933632 RepID=A0ACB8GFZ6_9SAUR
MSFNDPEASIVNVLIGEISTPGFRTGHVAISAFGFALDQIIGFSRQTIFAQFVAFHITSDMIPLARC